MLPGLGGEVTSLLPWSKKRLSTGRSRKWWWTLQLLGRLSLWKGSCLPLKITSKTVLSLLWLTIRQWCTLGTIKGAKVEIWMPPLRRYALPPWTWLYYCTWCTSLLRRTQLIALLAGCHLWTASLHRRFEIKYRRSSAVQRATPVTWWLSIQTPWPTSSGIPYPISCHTLRQTQWEWICFHRIWSSSPQYCGICIFSGQTCLLVLSSASSSFMSNRVLLWFWTLFLEVIGGLCYKTTPGKHEWSLGRWLMYCCYPLEKAGAMIVTSQGIYGPSYFVTFL